MSLEHVLAKKRTFTAHCGKQVTIFEGHVTGRKDVVLVRMKLHDGHQLFQISSSVVGNSPENARQISREMEYLMQEGLVGLEKDGLIKARDEEIKYMCKGYGIS